MALEPAIPPHLRAERTQPLNSPKGFQPTTPSFSARFDQGVSVTPVAYVGVQAPAYSERVREFEDTLTQHFTGTHGPLHWDRAEYVDEVGALNIIFACYWDSRTNYRLWHGTRPADWWHQGLELDGDIGSFLETYFPGTEDTETTFSHQQPEGLAKIAQNMSGETDTHGYWGSARDRIARTQYDPLAPQGDFTTQQPLPADTRGHLVAIEAPENVFVLRSGQDWSSTGDAERQFYLNDVKPHLDFGMQEIVTQGEELGCIFNRFLEVKARHEDESEKTYSLSAWRSLKQLEDWCRADSHLKIFAAGTRHFRTNTEGKLRLYHEGFALHDDDQFFQYFNCHRSTGMLRTFASAHE